ncbi:MAG: hypothetical protein QOH17_2154 [Pseudonocardiales bacterium]|nr:hypothetical protein [Pseudonocardiales bacterium]
MGSFSSVLNIDVRRLRVLRELDQHGTVTAAAAALHLTPSAVSQQLAGLARELGVPLIEKDGRGVRLTGQAAVLLRHAEAIAEQLERARAELAAFEAGTLGRVKVGSLSTGIAAVVAPALAQLRTSAPGLRIQVTEYEPTTAFDRLDACRLDVVVGVVHGATPPRTDARYFRVDLLTDVMDAVLPDGHPLADPDGVRLAALATEAWVSPAPDDPCAATTLVACAAAGFRPEIEHFCLEWDAVTALVAAGAGVALVPRTAQPLRQTGLVVCPLLGPPAARLLFAATRAGAESHPAVGAVLDALQSVAARRPDAAIPAEDSYSPGRGAALPNLTKRPGDHGDRGRRSVDVAPLITTGTTR